MPQRSSALLTVACVRDSREYTVQGISIRLFPGLVSFVRVVAYHFCLNLPAAFLQPGNSLIEIPCIGILNEILIKHIDIIPFQALPSWPQGESRVEFCCLQEIRRPLKCRQEGNDRHERLN